MFYPDNHPSPQSSIGRGPLMILELKPVEFQKSHYFEKLYEYYKQLLHTTWSLQITIILNLLY
jgi:hypothetical protein